MPACPYSSIYNSFTVLLNSYKNTAEAVQYKKKKSINSVYLTVMGSRFFAEMLYNLLW